MANLEAPLTNRTDTFMEKEFVLKVSTDAFGAIKSAGFDVLTLANNHIMDYGPCGLQDTMDILNKAGINGCRKKFQGRKNACYCQHKK